MALRTCGGCSRHVRDREERCPFCDAPLSREAVAVPTATRQSRALQMAFVATMLVGCRDEPKPTADPTPAPAPKVVEDTKPSMADPAPAVSETAQPADAVAEAAPPAPSPSPSPKVIVKPIHTATAVPLPNLAKPYGAPPADGLLV